MNITLIYKNNNYVFDLRKDVNIKYIQDLASKLIDKDCSTFFLYYKNNNLSDYQKTTLIKDLAKDEQKISIKITTPKNKSIKLSSNNLSKLKNNDLPFSTNSSNKNTLKLILNTQLKSSINSKNKNLSCNNMENTTSEYITENQIFEEIYNLKENEILSLMKNLSQKIKEYDNILYKQFKNDSKNSNKLSLFERSIIDFKDKEIKFLKKLLGFFDFNEKGIISLIEFYKELKSYNNPIYNMNEWNKNKINKNLESKTDSNKILDVSKNYRNYIQEKTLPLLPNTKNNKFFLSQNKNTISSVDSNENNSYFCDDKKYIKDHIFNSDKQKKYKNIVKEKIDISKIVKKSNKIKDNNIDEKNEGDGIKNNNLNKAISLSNTNDQTNTSQSTNRQGKIDNAFMKINKENKANKKNKSNKNIFNNLNIKKNEQTNEGMNTIINNKKKNKISVLFEEHENNNIINEEFFNNNENDSSVSSDRISKRKFSDNQKKYENKNLKNSNRNGEENNLIRKTRRSKGKNIKLVNNIYDFVI